MKTILKKSAAARFLAFRKSRRMTQKNLALALGISRRAVIYIEKSAFQPSLRLWTEFDALVERHKNHGI